MFELVARFLFGCDYRLRGYRIRGWKTATSIMIVRKVVGEVSPLEPSPSDCLPRDLSVDVDEQPLLLSTGFDFNHRYHSIDGGGQITVQVMAQPVAFPQVMQTGGSYE